ncbi:uncharacterized protein LOC143300817 [Babylonia areolata]|uniref:uncharacterized protein LOC143300817 n=1 Tax=Babylonia areolata TaxID=304850 RepID=UPI003FD1520E
MPGTGCPKGSTIVGTARGLVPDTTTAIHVMTPHHHVRGIRPHFQQTAIRFPPQRQSQHWTTFTTTAPPPALSHPSATFHNPADCSRIVVHTSQPQGTEVTSQPQRTEVTSPNPGAPVLVAGAVSGRLTEESTKPNISLVYLTIIGSFITMFWCPCFGIPALVVSIQALSKSSGGWYHEARMKLWCSFALIIASGFVIMPFIIPLLMVASSSG